MNILDKFTKTRSFKGIELFGDFTNIFLWRIVLAGCFIMRENFHPKTNRSVLRQWGYCFNAKSTVALFVWHQQLGMRVVYAGMVSKWLLELVKSFKRKYFSKQNQGEKSTVLFTTFKIFFVDFEFISSWNDADFTPDIVVALRLSTLWNFRKSDDIRGLCCYVKKIVQKYLNKH